MLSHTTEWSGKVGDTEETPGPRGRERQRPEGRTDCPGSKQGPQKTCKRFDTSCSTSYSHLSHVNPFPVFSTGLTRPGRASQNPSSTVISPVTAASTACAPLSLAACGALGCEKGRQVGGAKPATARSQTLLGQEASTSPFWPQGPPGHAEWALCCLLEHPRVDW